MMNLRQFILVLSCLLAGTGSVSCKKADDGGNVSAVRVNAKLSSCYQTGDIKDYLSWSSSSQASLVVIGKEKNYTAKVLDPTAGMFCFNGVEGPLDKTSKLYCWAVTDGATATFEGGKLKYTIPAAQNGTQSSHVMAGTAQYSSSATGSAITLQEQCCIMYVTLKQGQYTVSSISVKAEGGENICGNVTADPASGTFTADNAEVKVTFPSPLSCASNTQMVAVALAPVTLSKGYSISLETSDGPSTFSSAEAVTLKAGECVYTDKMSADSVRKLIACGSNRIYLFESDKVEWEGSYAKALKWSWDCTAAQTLCAGCAASSHIDDAKVVNNKKQILVTCSNNGGWCVLLEPDFKSDSNANILFWTNSSTNAHSADLLPGGYITVACSTSGGDCIQLYKIGQDNKPIAEFPLGSAHGCVWNETSQRLYAIGGTSLQIYTWNSSSGTLKLEKTVSTTGYVSGLHDLNLVDGNTLILGGKNAALYTINSNSFQSIEWFKNSSTNGIKSLNYNPDTKEIYYTFAVSGTAEGSYDWSSHKIRYTTTPESPYSASKEKHIIVDDINMYKVRVLNW